jgi:hypothetical protein
MHSPGSFAHAAGSPFRCDRVFKDVDSIEPGDDFAKVITESVRSCAVLLAVIGDRWLAAASQDVRRPDDPGDFVRLGIELGQGWLPGPCAGDVGRSRKRNPPCLWSSTR